MTALRFNILSIAVLALCCCVSMAETPDFGNNWQNAHLFNADESFVEGVLDAGGDVDWLKFIPSPQSIYAVTCINPESNYKEFQIFSANKYNSMICEITSDESIFNTSCTFYIYCETAAPIFIKAYDGAGSYEITAMLEQSFALDSYPDICSSPYSITLTGAITVVEGVIDNADIANPDKDCFTFDAVSHQKYRIYCTGIDSTNVRIDVLDENGKELQSNKDEVTYLSESGADCRIRIESQNRSHWKLGNYYQLVIEDLGYISDDHSDRFDFATTINTDSSTVSGSLDYLTSLDNDEDIFVFDCPGTRLYRFNYHADSTSLKRLKMYNSGYYDVLESFHKSSFPYFELDPNSSFEFSVEEPGPVYIKIYTENSSIGDGEYYFSIEDLGQIGDNYSNDPLAPTPITSANTTKAGTVVFASDGAAADYFTFNAQEGKIYKIRLYQPFGSEDSKIKYAMYEDIYQSPLIESYVDKYFAAPEDKTYTFRISPNHSLVRNQGSYYEFTIEEAGSFTDNQPSSWTQAMHLVNDGSTFNASIDYSTNLNYDLDYYSFTAPSDGTYTITGTEYISGSLWFRLFSKKTYDSPGSFEVSGSDSVSYNLTAGEYILKVEHDNPHGQRTGNYQITVESPPFFCGDLDHPYPPGDINQDCITDLSDYSLLASDWLTCTDPNPPCNYAP
ncbi:hypothetical protein [Sedimentisphaera salicampi]|uniref:PA14 domain protein n=1 Tax=Sedimentisphaera salicampi TaxID=1941349 RepID=A0A1W6LIU6_9BACT|nr:hypothetical protein [Sedimentisphaera salicampi]ARN55666.1 hypothetical protein STSP1_00026 [Sedimentisphaera salicampi]